MKRKVMIAILLVCAALGTGAGIRLIAKQDGGGKSYEKRIYMSPVGEWIEYYYKEDGYPYTRYHGGEILCAIPNQVREADQSIDTGDGNIADVLDFAHITAKDVVERIPMNAVQIGEEGGDATVTRVLVKGNGYGGGGLFYVGTDEGSPKSGGRYDIYDLKNGELVKLAQQVFEAEYERDGESMELHIEWATNGTAFGAGFVAGDGACLIRQWFGGGAPRALALLQFERQTYPVLLDLLGNQVEDITEKLDFNDIEGCISRARLSEDGSLLLLQAEKCYCYEIPDGKLLCLDEACGERLAGCGFVGDGSVCGWSLDFTFPDALVQQAIEESLAGETVNFDTDYGTIALYKVDPKAGTARRVFSDLSATVYTNPNGLWHGTEQREGVKAGLIYQNLMHMECRYLLELGEDDCVYVLDLADCSRKRLEGLSWPYVYWPDVDIIGNRAGDKILVCQRDQGGDIRRFSVVDLANERYLLVDRELVQAENEHLIDWLDDDTVMIDGNVRKADGSITGESWYSLYQFR